MEKLEPKEKKLKIENLYQFLGFLEKEFGKNATEKFFKPLFEQVAGADRVLGDRAEAKEERIKRLKDTKVSPMTIVKLNQIIDYRSKELEVELRNPERLEKNIEEEKKEMLSAMKGKEVVMDREGNIEIKTEKIKK